MLRREAEEGYFRADFHPCGIRTEQETCIGGGRFQRGCSSILNKD